MIEEQMQLSIQAQMQSAGKTLAASAVAVGLAIAGCGGSSTRSSPALATSTSAPTAPTTTPTATTTSPSPPPPKPASGRSKQIEGSIPGLLPGFEIPTRYTCYGQDVSLPVQWSGIPRGTVELLMFVINLRPVHEKLVFDWAVASLSPNLHGVSAGTLPPGAVVGRNSSGKVGFSICPTKGTAEEHYIVRLVALRHRLAAKPGFDAETLYRENEGSANVGLAGGVYTPP
jgi:phosphatidylethanolamine-binding protein (PEBP) family uncharacterized protein